MRFMLLMIPRSYAMPSADLVARMARYNDALANAGVLLALDGLHPPADGTRVAFAGGKASATDGPFAEAKEVIGGYWLIDVKSRDEAVAWASRCPAADGDVIEVRRVQEISDLPADVQKAIGATRGDVR
jgi:hypothetical protein